ncbi:MAG: hypothetical protein IJ668_06080 [Selenomonadaceae bacterium]|nr:hypothetical protein [Selenomonadaceae bacterium]
MKMEMKKALANAETTLVDKLGISPVDAAAIIESARELRTLDLACRNITAENKRGSFMVLFRARQQATVISEQLNGLLNKYGHSGFVDTEIHYWLIVGGTDINEPLDDWNVLLQSRARHMSVTEYVREIAFNRTAFVLA